MAKLRKRVAEPNKSGSRLERAEDNEKLQRWFPLLDIIQDVICFIDLKCRVQYCNKTMRELLSKPREEIIGHKCWELMHETSGPIKDCPFKRMLKSGRRETVEYQFNDRHFMVTVDPVLDSMDKIIGGIHITSDITERIRAKEQIIKANERLKFLLSGSSAVIYTAKPEGDYGATFISESIRQMAGYEPSEFLDNFSFWLNHVHPEDRKRVLEEEQGTLKDSYYFVHEYRFKHKDGHYIRVSDKMRLVPGKKGEPVEIIGFWTDITEQKKRQLELQKHKNQLEMKVEERTAELKKANRDLIKEIREREKAAKIIEEKNIALRQVLSQLEIEKKVIRDNIINNVTMLILPVINDLRQVGNNIDGKYMDLLEGQLKQLTSSFGIKITDVHFRLTTREMRICDLIKGGLTSKDIGNLLNISPKTVESFRTSIRNKLGIKNKQVNLQNFLQGL